MPPSIAISDLDGARTVRELIRDWRACVQAAPQVRVARALYQGRSIVDADTATRHLGANLYIVSAGLGLVSAEQEVDGYDCTVAPSSNLAKRLTSEGLQPAYWWEQLTARDPFPLSNLLRRASGYIAMPATYLRLVHDDLARLSKADAGGLRIFTSPAGANEVPKHLGNNVLPYDERLESISSHAGTQADFPQRAMRHFVEHLAAPALTLEEARAAVATALAPWNRRQQPLRIRLTDEEICSHLRAQWTRHAGSSTRLLRFLRDEALVSCEQKRFSRLWQRLQAELEKT